MKALVYYVVHLYFLTIATAIFGDITSNLPDCYVRLDCIVESYDHHLQGFNSYNNQNALPNSPADGMDRTSSNWGGYLSQTTIDSGLPGSVTQVTGSWIIPTMTCSSSTGFYTSASSWVGIGGWDSDSPAIQQLGTDCYCSAEGDPHYYAWFEMFPRDPVLIKKVDGSPFPIMPGDVYSAEVIYMGTQGNEAVFLLSMINHTQQAYTIVNFASTMTTETPIMTSAEWITEAQSSNGGHPLADFGEVTFSNCYTTINDVYGPINDPNWEYAKITMEDGNHPKEYTSDLDPSGTSFTMTWIEQGG